MLLKYEEALDGVTSGVHCNDNDKGTAAASAAALDGVWAINAEFRFSLTERYRGGRDNLLHLHFSNLAKNTRYQYHEARKKLIIKVKNTRMYLANAPRKVRLNMV